MELLKEEQCKGFCCGDYLSNQSLNRIKIINVGQGDSFILSPCRCCKTYGNSNIYIDVGSGQQNVSQYSDKEEIVLSLSHSHVDHIGGLSQFFIEATNKVKEIWLPLYFDEIVLITKALTKLKGIEQIPANSDSQLQNILSVSGVLSAVSKNLDLTIKGFYDGCKPSEHITILNPPLSIEDIIGVSKGKIGEFVKEVIDSDFEKIKGWFSEDFYKRMRDVLEGKSSFKELSILYNIPTLIQDENLTEENRRNFIYGLLYVLKGDIERFVDEPNTPNFNRLYNKLKLSSNDASLMLKYKDSVVDILFTGDAGKKVFDRLMKAGRQEIKVNIFKVPHHGSSHNLNKTILEYIKPKYAIVCHDNRKFGRQKDNHPNRKIIELLDSLGIETYYTNDVIKEKKPIKIRPVSQQLTPFMSYHDRI